jgi:hypothetical protein
MLLKEQELPAVMRKYMSAQILPSKPATAATTSRQTPIGSKQDKPAPVKQPQAAAAHIRYTACLSAQVTPPVLSAAAAGSYASTTVQT